MSQITSWKLANGTEIPCIGYGTWKTSKDDVKNAILNGYRHIDTAASYGNEAEVGEGIKTAGVKREDLFITGKLWVTERAYENVFAAYDNTCQALQTEYLDLYLIHWPADPSKIENWDEVNLETWRAMTELYRQGKVKAIGVSNFLPMHLESLMKTEVPPMVDQVEFHPGMMQKEVKEYCSEHGIVMEAWSPLGTGRMLRKDFLKELAEKYQRSVAQICIRWALENEVLPLPKTANEIRMQENLQVFDFELKPEDKEYLDTLKYCGGSGLRPDRNPF